MRAFNIISLLVAFVFAMLVGCGEPKTAEQKVKDNVSAAVYVLTPEDRQRAEANAKTYFNKEWVIANGQRGQFNNCKPTDSNFNGMVSCYGYVPQPNDTFKEEMMYCGYDGKINGCSPDDLVVNR